MALIFVLPIGALCGFLAALFGLTVTATLPPRLAGNHAVRIAGVCLFVAGAGAVELLTTMNVLQHFEITWWITIGLTALGALGFTLLVQQANSPLSRDAGTPVVHQ